MVRGVAAEDRQVRRNRRENLVMSRGNANAANVGVVIVVSRSVATKFARRVIHLCEL